MAVSESIKDYLRQNGVRYVHKAHPLAYTAQEIAAAEHVPGRELAKTVVLKADDRLIIAVLPADRVIDMEALKEEAGADRLSLAPEEEFAQQFPSCEVGAMPPFGKLYGLPVYCDKSLERQAEIEFNAGAHTDVVRMKFSEFARIENPIMLDFAEKAVGRPIDRAA